MSTSVHLSTTLVWTCTAILAVLDVLVALLVWRKMSREQFFKTRWILTISGGVFFLLVWSSVMLWGWDWFYAYIFPSWARYALPPIFSLGYALVAYGMAWLSLKLKGSPAITWCILGGVEGLLSHIYAIYSLGAASKPPIMHGTHPFAVLFFAVFEKAFYWSIILLACWVLSNKMSSKAAQLALRAAHSVDIGTNPSCSDN